jgi:hypothetical protein
MVGGDPCGEFLAEAALIPMLPGGAVSQLVPRRVEPQAHIGGPGQAGTPGSRRKRTGHEPGLGDDVPVDRQVDRQPVGQVGDGGDSRRNTSVRPPSRNWPSVLARSSPQQILDRCHQRTFPTALFGACTRSTYLTIMVAATSDSSARCAGVRCVDGPA